MPFGFDHTYFLDEELSLILYNLLQAPVEKVHEVEMTRVQRKLLVGHLLDFYALHIENLPKIHSHAILEEVLGGN